MPLGRLPDYLLTNGMWKKLKVGNWHLFYPHDKHYGKSSKKPAGGSLFWIFA